MYLKIRQVAVWKTKYWWYFYVQKVWIYKNDGTWIKWCKLNESLKNYMLDLEIPCNITIKAWQLEIPL